jgi:hypothetical protein
LLASAGKKAWCRPREGKVMAKGVGEVTTYFLNIESIAKTVTGSNLSDDSTYKAGGDPSVVLQQERNDRLVSWNAEKLLHSLKLIIAHRMAQGKGVSTEATLSFQGHTQKGNMPFHEVKEVIELPERDARVRDDVVAEYLTSISIGKQVEAQAKTLVKTIADGYSSNSDCPFHNYEHCTHVVQAVTKLLSRIVAPRISDLDDDCTSLHDHTYG